MNNDSISIIIPVYNSEKYIERCIGSILRQDYEDYEIIIVDDGSTDNTFQICNDFSKKDNRIRVITQENGGPGKARNSGLNVAAFENIMFVDSDDYIKQGFLKRISKISGEADFIIFGMTFLFDNSTISISPAKEKTVYSQYDFFNCKEFYDYKSMMTGPVSRIFKKSIINQNQIRFDSSMTCAEDSLFDIQYVSKCKSVCLDKTNYYCCDKTNEMSITHRFIPRKTESMITYINGAEEVFSAFRETENYKIFVKNQLYNLISALTYVFQNITDKNERMRNIKMVSNCSFLKNHYSRTLSFKQKVIVLLLKTKMLRLVYLVLKTYIKGPNNQ